MDSDEHDEEAHITESHEVRQMMQDKRLKKAEEIKKRAYLPTKIGKFTGADTVVIAWGSNRGVVEEALDIIGNNSLVGLHFSQVYPLASDASKLLKGKKLVVLENNASGQFAQLLQLEYGVTIDEKILQYDGAPFAVEDVVERLKKIIA